jgi:snRNA-activating protein complex subunit 3
MNILIINIDLILARLDTNAILFMRTPKNSDNNLLDAVVRCGNFYSYLHDTYLFFIKKATKGPSLEPGVNDVIVTISAYTRVPWGPSYVNRSSQHAFLSSQSLQDVYGAIPCTSNNLPPEAGDLGDRSSCVICIEGFAYGSGIEGHDYSE